MTNLVTKFADRFSVSQNEVKDILKSTCFKAVAAAVSDAHMDALLIVANQYNLNPFLKEIYAYPDRNNGIVPVVSIDGWARIINEHPMFDGLDFTEGGDDDYGHWMECVIYRKDRGRPIKIREYMAEVKRGTDPWKSHPRRMLRHKTLIQCARIAFGFAGIYDEDEAQRIVEKDITPTRENPVQIAQEVQTEVIDVTAQAKLRADLDAVADLGTAELEKAWKGLSREQRKLHGPISEATKERAKNADAFLQADEYVPE